MAASCGHKSILEDSVDRRVEDLLSQMTLQEKIGQLNQVSLLDGFSEEVASQIADGKVGSILNEADPAIINYYQKVAVEKTRLGIPLLVCRDVIHGFNTMFPIPLGLAATFDPELVQQGARMAAEEATARGIRLTFSPMLDIARDPRWGRIAEGSGEDTYLNEVMGVAMVRGYQGDLDDTTCMASCIKHFVAYGAAEGGRDYNSTGVTERVLRNFYLPPFEACVKAGAMSLMTSFNDNDGIPSSANGFLLKDVLRHEWGFDGFVVTDWNATREMINHGFAVDNKHAGELSMNAGVDMDMVSFAYIDHLEELLDEGKVSMKQIDNAVRNVLRVKFRLGLFEHPYADVEKAKTASYAPAVLEAARVSAVESTVLLDNDGILPLDKAKVKTVLVTGPMADSPYEQMGTWSMDGEGSRTVTPLKALKDLYGDDVRIIYEPGIESCLDKAGKGVGKALAAARKADVVLAFMGELAIMSGEAHSLAEITLKGDQRAFLEALYKTGTPVVLTVMAGRPLELGFELDHSDAILYSFHPGTMGGPALAQLIFGDETPSGKTPVSFPKSRGQIPVYYNHNMTGRPYRGETLLDEYQASGRQTSLGGTSVWLDSGLDPQFPFGHGLTYTTFEYSEPKLDQVEYGMDDTIIAEVMITNTGNRKATEVMQLYVRDLVGSVTRPVKELKGFKRITLEPGETKTVKFGLPVQNLAFYGQDMVKKVETGDFHLWIAGNSASGVPVAFSVY